MNVRKPPTPIEIAPAISSATPPSTTIFDSPRLDKPAVRAKGTVRPSDSPITLEKGRKISVKYLVCDAKMARHMTRSKKEWHEAIITECPHWGLIVKRPDSSILSKIRN